MTFKRARFQTEQSALIVCEMLEFMGIACDYYVYPDYYEARWDWQE